MRALLLLLALGLPLAAAGAPTLVVTVANPGALARPAETIAVPWAAVARGLPGARLHHLAVRGPDHGPLAYQVTNVRPQARDPQHVGLAYGDLLFQHDFAAGEAAAVFTVEATDAITPPFPSRVFCRFVPERYDDFAWENDKVAHRTYGPALEAPDVNHTGKEVSVESGIDVWCKRVAYLTVDRWYTDENYHRDQGEGMDMYEVGPSRGCGGTGIWDGQRLWVSRNFETWRVIANGPIRAIFELHYAAWAAAGRRVSETKRYTVDAGHYLDQVDSTFVLEPADRPGGAFTVAIGLDKVSAERGQDPQRTDTRVPADGSVAFWQVEKTHGALGTAVILAPGLLQGYADTATDALVLVRAQSGVPVRFYAGAGWTGRGEFSRREDWDAYVAAWAARLRQPVTVTVATPG